MARLSCMPISPDYPYSTLVRARLQQFTLTSQLHLQHAVGIGSMPAVRAYMAIHGRLQDVGVSDQARTNFSVCSCPFEREC